MPSEKNKDTKIRETSAITEIIESVKANKIEAYVFIVFHLVFAVILRYCYPFPDITPDTGGYINIITEDFIHGGPRPSGYSYFIYYVNAFASGTLLIFLTQYIIYCIAIWFFYSGVTYLLGIKDAYIRFTFLIVSIVFIPGLYTTNMLISDNLFTSLTLLLITFCMWLLHNPGKYLLIPIIILLMACIMLRYIGMVYLAVIIPVVLISYKQKVFAIAASFLIVVLVYAYTENVKQQTGNDLGVEVFSGFAGWQKANNALHIIPHIDISESAIGDDADNDILKIDTIVRMTYPFNKSHYPDFNSVSYDFIWSDSLPLRTAFWYQRLLAREESYYHNWNIAGVQFSEYADLLVKQHPKEFFRYYILNNTVRAFHPPVEVFESFADSVYTPVISDWFNLASGESIRPTNDFLRPLLRNLSVFYSFYWILFGISVMYIAVQLTRRKMNISSGHFKIVILLSVFTLVYLLASIYAAPVNLRFLLPVRVTILGLAFALIQRIVATLKKKEETTIV